MDVFANDNWLALVFMALMGISILAYVILDGYDLGVGILMRYATKGEKDKMIASIGPFWDANETWLVMGVGILLVAFPVAHGIILTALYLPVAAMLGGLILRGVSFDFRAKAKDHHKHLWDKTFMAGSMIATFSQGYMLGYYILGFTFNIVSVIFSILAGACLLGGYSFVGAGWLIMKTEGKLQEKAVYWARRSLAGIAFGMLIVSIITPIISHRIYDRWFTPSHLFYLFPFPLLTAWLVIKLELLLRDLPMKNDRLCWMPFVGAVGLFALGFFGIAYSFYPYIVPEKMTIFEAAAAPESLKIILVGAVVVIPCIASYTVFAYRVFWGKVKDLTYY